MKIPGNSKGLLLIQT